MNTGMFFSVFPPTELWTYLGLIFSPLVAEAEQQNQKQIKRLHKDPNPSSFIKYSQLSHAMAEK